MKLIKKIAAIMFAFMMVFSLSTNVRAESGVNNKQGSITISNAIKDQEYKIYKILDLESFNSTEGSEAYSYKLTNDAWKSFFGTGGPGESYVSIDNQNYVTWKSTDTDAANLANAAIAFAQDKNNNVTEVQNLTKTTSNNSDGTVTVTYSGLDLGYYLVESSVGALCSLNTTNPNAEITEKNSQPTLEKKIIDDNEGLVDKKTADIGEKIHYQVDITVGKGAKSYVFHDQIESGLEYEKTNQKLALDITTDCYTTGSNNRPQMVKPTDSEYHLTLSENKFTLTFEDSFIQKLSEGNKIIINYNAYVTGNAQMDTALKNTAYLNYGNNQKTREDHADVYTYKIPVFKYTLKDTTETKLSGAKFKLYRGSKNVNNIVKFDSNGNTYTYNKSGTVEELESGTDGYVNINGLAAGTYTLEETKAPDGYNILKDTITITVNQKTDGTKEILSNNEATNGTVKVLNNKGSLLPSTGGMGTTLIYLIGGALVLGSGFVLANKKRAKAK
ncbi:SpaH/EbpB family LPXTG-anchored major pilin [uncultured Holdemanella sp.]|uniref:SpaH/EbpB family LPXTG-anchored major pilin n=1 Tax=uncultured Holdemanella sp. TaxID=1763549 RepID=UPI0025E96AE2|nr:SpaH/EbpB family LPXTG-anchored major pilin [uncultured Holdemanella sp.]